MSDILDDDLFGDADLGEMPMEALEVMPEPIEPKKATKSKTPAKSSGLGLDFSSLAGAGVVVGKTGISVRNFTVDRTRFTTDSKARIAILSDDVICFKTHYKEGIGNFICFEGDCCRLGLPKIRYAYPCIQYDTDSEGNVISNNYEFKTFCITQPAYDALQRIQESDGALSGIDLVITCEDAKFQKISIESAGNCMWTQIPGVGQAAQKFWSENMKDSLKAIAKTLTAEEYKELTAPSKFDQTVADVDFDQVFGN